MLEPVPAVSPGPGAVARGGQCICLDLRFTEHLTNIRRMPRPSQDQDRALLTGCAGLSVRRVAEAAGVNPAMFSELQLNSQGEGDVMERLTAALMGLARFVRAHRPLLARVWADAQAGEAVAQDFLRAKAPRHLGVLLPLLQEAEALGRLPRAPMLTRFSFLAGAVVAPLLLVGGLRAIGAVPAPLLALVDEGVLSDEALMRRIDWALLRLASGA